MTLPRGNWCHSWGVCHFSSHRGWHNLGSFLLCLMRTHQSFLETWPHFDFQYAVIPPGKIPRELLNNFCMPSWWGPKAIPTYMTHKNGQQQSCHLRHWMPCLMGIWTFLAQACPNYCMGHLHQSTNQPTNTKQNSQTNKQKNKTQTNKQNSLIDPKLQCDQVSNIFTTSVYLSSDCPLK